MEGQEGAHNTPHAIFVLEMMYVFVPIILVYVVVGWGRANPIFLPLRSLSTVTTKEDGSTLARNAENLGLIATASYTNIATVTIDRTIGDGDTIEGTEFGLSVLHTPGHAPNHLCFLLEEDRQTPLVRDFLAPARP